MLLFRPLEDLSANNRLPARSHSNPIGVFYSPRSKVFSQHHGRPRHGEYSGERSTGCRCEDRRPEGATGFTRSEEFGDFRFINQSDFGSSWHPYEPIPFLSRYRDEPGTVNPGREIQIIRQPEHFAGIPHDLGNQCGFRSMARRSGSVRPGCYGIFRQVRGINGPRSFEQFFRNIRAGIRPSPGSALFPLESSPILEKRQVFCLQDCGYTNGCG